MCCPWIDRKNVYSTKVIAFNGFCINQYVNDDPLFHLIFRVDIYIIFNLEMFFVGSDK